jgi:hypothetical protein
LEWLGVSRVVLVIARFSDVLADEPIERPAFGRAVRGALMDFNTPKNRAKSSDDPFRIVLDCKVMDDPVLKQLLVEIAPAQVVGRI